MPNEPYEPHSANSWWDRLVENWKTEKDNALRDGSQAAVDAYNESSAGKNHPITQDELDYLGKNDIKGHEGTSGVDDRVPILSKENAAESTATEAADYEIELSKKRERERDEAKKKQESFLANQPYYPVSENTKKMIEMFRFIGTALGGITDASGSGSPQYTIPAYEIKESPAYDVDQGKETGGGLAQYTGQKKPTYDRLSDFASASGNSTYLKQTF